ncbi:MAG TPA: XRE family transcriptional regulator [Candidatus Acidoferrales bacterium]|nr:XRE family transcriptional regulator [Candidatus Acidoferrales bacterium]
MSGGRLEIALRPDVLRWARERAGLEPDVLAGKLGVKPERVREWERSGRISLAQADKLAHHTHTPLGFLYLPEPVDDRLPIPDLRTVGDRPPQRPSPELLDTIQAMQRRQAWMRDELIEQGSEPLAFVGSLGLDQAPERAADAVREVLGLEPHWAQAEPSWTDALRRLRDQAEQAGVLVVFNGVVGNNTHRPLDPEEFRGFALVDDYAPLVFVNGADFKAAQIFTLVHELAHLWCGAGGVSNFEALQPAPDKVEQFCNRVAAEFLVPATELRAVWRQVPEGDDRFQFLARRFRVSSIVAARRALDLALIDRSAFFAFYRAWQTHERRVRQRGEGGGSFWNNQNVRIGRRFGAAVVRAVKEGRLLYRDAYALTGLKGATFDQFARQMGRDP